MAYRWRGKYFEVDPDNPAAEGICDRCGFRHNLHKLRWQFAYQGSTMPQNTRFLVCYKCYDPLNPQDMPFILPPDPEPIFNARPEPYTLDELSPLGISTETGAPLIVEQTAGPPFDPAINVRLTGALKFVAGVINISVAYLDIFNGDPLLGTGTSVLASIIGTSTRPNLYAQLQVTGAAIGSPTAIYENPGTITLTTSCKADVNFDHAAIYDAPNGGNLLASGRLNVIGPPSTLAAGVPVQFDPLTLQIGNVAVPILNLQIALDTQLFFLFPLGWMP